MSNLKKVQNVNKSAEETDVELDGEMSMDAELIGKFITQQVGDAMAERKTVWKEKKNIEKDGKGGVLGELEERNKGRWTII